MAAMIQFPTKLPIEVVAAIEKAVEMKIGKSKNDVVVKTLIKGLKVKIKN